MNKPTNKQAKQNKIPLHIRVWRTFKAAAIWKKLLLFVILFCVIFAAQAYAISYWYQKKHSNEPLTIGVTYIANYSRFLGVDPEETMLALRDDLGFKRFRLVSYWKDIEKTPGQYDFTELDWQFSKVNEVGGEVSLAIGLRQPRWPECHAPEWVNAENKDQWYPELKKFMAKVIERYGDNPALVSYQLENEYFLGVFGECTHFGIERERLIDEFNHVKSLDSNTPVILSYANNYFGVATGQPQPDQVGVSVYKRVWEQTVTKRYFEYPFPSWYYSWRAGLQEILKGQDSMLHELQAEPWTPTDVKSATKEEQYKSMDPARLQERIEYGVATGFRDIDLWGGEWWYWRKEVMNDPSLWEAARESLTEVCSTENCAY